MDLVLFGSQDSSSLIKDIALACLLICLISLLIIFKAYKNRAKKQMEELSTRLSKLRDMETDFEGVHQQQKFELKKFFYIFSYWEHFKRVFLYWIQG